MSTQIITELEDVDRALFLHLTMPPMADSLGQDVYVESIRPDSNREDEDEIRAQHEQAGLPFVRIKYGGTLKEGDVGSSHQPNFFVESRDPQGKPLSYRKVDSGELVDIPYEVRYSTYRENDARAVSGQLAARLRAQGFLIPGPTARRFYFERVFSGPMAGALPNQIAGLFRVMARNVAIDQRDLGRVAAIRQSGATVQVQSESL